MPPPHPAPAARPPRVFRPPRPRSRRGNPARSRYHYGHRFYSPALGRWEGRDPLGERGDRNLYSFLGNQSCQLYDLLGLKGCCGPDITSPLYATVRNVESKFASWSEGEKASKCAGMKLAHVVLVGWDILPLFNLGDSGSYTFDGGARGTSPCERTVVFNGKCVQANAANYILFGTAFRLCDRHFGHYPKHEALNSYVEPYKDLWVLRSLLLLGDMSGALRARAQARFFTVSGFDRSLRHDAWRELDEETDCIIERRNKVSNADFTWRWLGMAYEH